MNTVNIKGLKHSAVLAALYNGSKPLGMGFLQYDPRPMTEEEAEQILSKQLSFDYLKGRVMKISFASPRLEGDELHIDLYDRDNGDGTARRIINNLRFDE